MADEHDLLDDPDFVASAQTKESAWEERHRAIMRDRRKAAWAARRRKIFSARTLVVALAVAGTAAYVVQQRSKDSGDEIVAETGSGETTDTTGDRLEARDYAPGDCVTWRDDDPGQRATFIVPCHEEHRIEIAGKVKVPGDTYPADVEEWSGLIMGHCPPVVRAFIGGPIDPDGRYKVGGIYPSREGWNAGDHGLDCGVQSNMGPAGMSSATLFTGKARADNQVFTPAIGSCGNNLFRGEVPCDQPHDSEVVGHVDLTGRFETPPPLGELSAWERLLSEPCRKAGTAYMGHPESESLRIGFTPIGPDSWAAGKRVAACVVSRKENNLPVKSTGSVRAS